MKPRSDLEVPINKVLGPKRSSKEMLRGTEKADLTNKKSKVSIIEGLHVLSGVNQITTAEVAMQPRRTL